MPPRSSLLHHHNGNTKRATTPWDWSRGRRAFDFLAGVVVGTVVVSLVAVNLYAGSFLKQPLLEGYQQHQHQQHQYEQHQQHQYEQQHQHQHQQHLHQHQREHAGQRLGQQRQGQPKEQHQPLTSNAAISDVTPAHVECETNTNETPKENTDIAPEASKLPSLLSATTTTTTTSTLLGGSNNQSKCETTTKPPSFFELAKETGTDKVKGVMYLPPCLEDDSKCTRPSCEREECRPWGHFYHTMYQQKLSKFLDPSFGGTGSGEGFQLLEIGYNMGFGYDAYKKFFESVPGAELHTIEISCIEEGPREEGKWPWGNFAKESKDYQSLLDRNLLHCGDASDVNWLHQIWNERMYQRQRDSGIVNTVSSSKPTTLSSSSSSSSPPLKIVIDDGSHLAKHMIYSFFFWFPRIEPGGILIIEDVQPIEEANLFRTQFLPQIMADLHFCGDPHQKKDGACFPQLYSLLQSVHCEMHICVFERNNKPALSNLSIEDSTPPPNALNSSLCYTFSNGFGEGMEAV